MNVLVEGILCCHRVIHTYIHSYVNRTTCNNIKHNVFLINAHTVHAVDLAAPT